MENSKPELRQALKKIRQGMSVEEVEAKSEAITKELIGDVDWAKIKNLHIYSGVPGWKEVGTKQIIDYVREQRPEIEIAIADISARQEVPEQQFSLIVVPCLGFDKELYRLGLGDRKSTRLN